MGSGPEITPPPNAEPTDAPSPKDPAEPGSSSQTNVGLIAGMAVLATVLVAVIIGGVLLYRHKQKAMKKKAVGEVNAEVPEYSVS